MERGWWSWGKASLIRLWAHKKSPMILLRVEAAADERGMTWAKYQALERTKTSRVWTLWRRTGSLLLAQVRRVDWRPARTLVQVEDTEAVKVGQISKPSTLIEEAACSQGRGQSWRPSHEPRPRMRVEDGPSRSLEGQSDGVHLDYVREVAA